MHDGYLARPVFAGLLTMLLLGCGERQDTTHLPKNHSVASSAFEPSADDVVHHNRAVAQMGQFQFEAARADFDQLVQQHPHWLAARIDLAIATLNRQQPGDSERAEQILDDVLRDAPSDLRARHCRGILKLNRGDFPSAQEDFQTVIDRDPADAYATYFSGRCFFEMGDYEQAKSRYAKASQLDPYLRSAYYGAMQAAQRLDQKEEVGELLGDFQKLATNPQAHLAEIKYTRMGPKAEVRTTGVVRDETPTANPEGPLFQPLQPLAVENASDNMWRPQPGPNEPSPLPSSTVCDINADGRLDLFFTSSLSGENNRHNAVLFAEENDSFRIDLEHPLTSVNAIEAVLWGDFDNDGLTDVYFCQRGPNQLWRQTAAGQWQDVTEETRTAGGDANTIAGAFFDADHDGDLDLFLVNSQAPNELMSNNLDGTFRPLAESQGIAGASPNSRGVLAVDLDGDRDRDIVVVNAATPHEVFLNDRLWNYHKATGFDAFNQTACEAAAAADLDADGQVELVTLSENELLHWAPDVNGQWTSRSLAQLPRNETSLQNAQLQLADINGDGRLEAIVCDSGHCWIVSTSRNGKILFEIGDTKVAGWRTVLLDPRRGPSLIGHKWAAGPVALLPGAGRHPFLAITFTGRDNQAEQMRSNRSGIGIQGAARFGSRWCAFDSLPCSTVPGQSLVPVAIGLGGADHADFLTVLWPDGVLQTEIDLSVEQFHQVQETQRQLSSCPVVFVWNGQEYEFVTDILGVGGLGFNLAKGEYSEPRPYENLLLPQDLLIPRAGKFEIKIGEPMEEVCYLDSARLVAYELPLGWQMTLDERLATAEPLPTGQPFFYQQQLIPCRAVNDRGEDVTEQIRQVDQIAAPPGELDSRFIGRTALHTIEIVFEKPLDTLLSSGASDSKSELVLIFHGWIEYPYSQTMFAAWQAGAEYSPPTLEAKDVDGNWQTVLKQFGYMAGMPREAAVPLPNLPEGCDALRLTTNCEIYWDHIKVVAAVDCPQVVRHELPLQEARVSESGFALRTTRSDRLPHYDYQRRSPMWDTRHQAGYYTAFGDALPLVSHLDNAVAIIGPGEEVHLEFEANDEPLQQGWTRHYVLESFGWCKDMDLYTKHGEQVEPLPVRDFSDADLPADTNRQSLHQQFNRRYRDGP